MPGSHLLAIASRWFDERTVASVFEPLVADWQREWQDATQLRRIGVWIRGATALLTAIIASSPRVLLAPSPPGVMRRVVTRLAIWTTALTVLNVAPFLREVGNKFDTGIALYLLVLLLPQALAIAFPMAIATVVDVIRTAPRPTREERITALRLAMAACAVMFVLNGWVFPAANQEYRVFMSRTASGSRRGPMPARGLNELSIVELLKDDRLASWRQGSGDPIFDAWVASGARAEPVLSTITQRFLLALLPMVFMWMRWRALVLPRGRWYSAAPLFVSVPLVTFCCFTLMAQHRAVADLFYAPRWAGQLLIVPIMIAAAILIDRLRRRAAAFDCRTVE